MLGQERTALAASLNARRLDIREKDLNNLTSFLDGLSTQSALLAGFAFVSFAELPAGTNLGLKYALYICTAISLGANLFVVCVGQLATILGPTLALNGPVGSMEKVGVGEGVHCRVYTVGCRMNVGACVRVCVCKCVWTRGLAGCGVLARS